MPIGVHAGVNFAQWAINDNSGIWKVAINDQLRSRVDLMSHIIGIAVILLVTFLFWRLHIRVNCDDAESKVSD